MKRGVRPIAHARDEAVLERIDVAIFDMARIVGLVADQVLPEPALPDAAFVARDADSTEPFLFRKRSRESSLYQSPARRKIMIARRQLPDGMQMVGQYHEGIDREGMVLACYGNGLAQALDEIDEQGFLPLQQVDGEEPAATRNEGATIIRHEIWIAHVRVVL